MVKQRVQDEKKEIREVYNLVHMNHLPFTHIGGEPVAFATRNDIAISSQFLVDQFQYSGERVHEQCNSTSGKKMVNNILYAE